VKKSGKRQKRLREDQSKKGIGEFGTAENTKKSSKETALLYLLNRNE